MCIRQVLASLAAMLVAAAVPALTWAAGGALVPATAAEIQEALRAPGARATLVNVWASWCVPCREEMPDLLRLRSAYAERGLRFILVSGDFSTDASQAADFLREQGVDFPSYIKKGGDAELIDALDPHWSGTLPATFLFDEQHQLRQAIHGKVSYDALDAQIRTLLSGTP